MNIALKEALAAVWCDDLQASIVDAGLVKQCDVEGGLASIRLVYGFAAKSQHAAMRQKVTMAARKLEGVREVRVVIDTQIVAHAAQHGVERLGQVRNVIAVASGKGGVGKSTTTVNLALALAAEGARVGVLDADIYGPSIPTMLGITGRPESEDGQSIEPKEGHGLQTSSIGYLIDKDEAMIWRGPMVTQALEQLLRQTNWRDLDYLIIDLPPGTGDIHLTLSQRVPITGAVIVTTPQEVAIMDARKGLRMFEKVSVPVLGVVENMSTHLCSNCGHVEHIFGSGGAQTMASDFNISVLASLPLDIRIRRDADDGRPTLVSDPDGEISAIYMALARKVSVSIAKLGRDMTGKFPKIVIQKT